MDEKWPWRKLRSLETGFVCAAVAATGFAIWKKDDLATTLAQENSTRQTKLIQQKNTCDIPFISTPETYKTRLKSSITKARDLCQIVKDDYGLPGLTIAVSVNGTVVWEEGLGYADVENRVPMKPDAVLRIASISKSMTMAMLGKLLEDGKINLDCPIQTYLPNFPEKNVDGEQVTITTRQLLSHMSGIRHYLKKGEKNTDEMSLAEYFLKEKFDSTDKALELFQNDELHHKPGTKYLYTTHGWTVVSAIIEKITETPFPKHSKKMFQFWGLKNTFLDEHEPLVCHRARYYSRNKHGRLINSPYVDNSYKWAGGGFQSNVTDLVQFAHILLASFQHDEDVNSKDSRGFPNKPYLKQSTIQQIWTPTPNASTDPDSDLLYGMGFQIAGPMRRCLFCKEIELMTVAHGGAAIGSSSTLYLAFPKDFRFRRDYDQVDGRLKPSDVLTNNTDCEDELRTKLRACSNG